MPAASLRHLLVAWMLLILTACTPAMLPLAQGSARTDETEALSQGITGLVLGIDGKPAANVRIRGQLAPAAGLISNNSGSLISNNSGSLTTSYRTQSEGLETRTDANGRFVLRPTGEHPINIEATLADDVKALLLNVSASARELKMALAYTGAIRGSVRTEREGQQLLGIDVFIPGTGYLAKTDEQGHFEILHVPVGSYTLAAIHTNLGRGVASGVEVQSKQITDLAPIVLSVLTPTIAAASPSFAIPGATIELIGEHFGVSEGKHPEVLISGIQAQVEEVSDTLLRAIVPAGVASGQVQVKINGLGSNVVELAILKYHEVYADYWEPFATQSFDPDKPTYAPSTDYLAVGVQRRYRSRGLDIQNRIFPDLQGVSWSFTSDDGGAIAIGADGTVTALSPGTVILRAKAGNVWTTDLDGVETDFVINVVPPILEFGYSRPLELGTLPTAENSEALPDGDVADAESGLYRMTAIWSSQQSGVTTRYNAFGLPVAQIAKARPLQLVTLQARCMADPSKIAAVPAQLVHRGYLKVSMASIPSGTYMLKYMVQDGNGQLLASRSEYRTSSPYASTYTFGSLIPVRAGERYTVRGEAYSSRTSKTPTSQATVSDQSAPWGGTTVSSVSF